MNDRKQMEGPATVLAVTLAALLIAGGAIGLAVSGVPDKEYTVSWATVEESSAHDEFAGTGTTTLRTTATDARVKQVVVSIPACEDSADGTVRAPATITLTLKRSMGTGVIDYEPQTLSCADDERTFTFAATEAPTGEADVKAPDMESARDEVLADAAQPAEDATYTLDVSVSRPGSPLDPVPIGGPEITGEVHMVIEAWELTLTEKEEVVHQ